jgi:hypothetical protein
VCEFVEIPERSRATYGRGKSGTHAGRLEAIKKSIGRTPTSLGSERTSINRLNEACQLARIRRAGGSSAVSENEASSEETVAVGTAATDRPYRDRGNCGLPISNRRWKIG